jgi:aromatic ring-opening dioxygenase catalytic subunit (LigB family)
MPNPFCSHKNNYNKQNFINHLFVTLSQNPKPTGLCILLFLSTMEVVSGIIDDVTSTPIFLMFFPKGPLPLMGRQESVARHLREVVNMCLPDPPKAIVVISAHWESDNDKIKITSSANPSMLFDYYGFPPETYHYEYPAKGDPDLATRIQHHLNKEGIESEMDIVRGFDHGVFVPLLLMYPQAQIPVVCVSLHRSLDAAIHLRIGKALSPLREEEVLILGSGYTFHNMQVRVSYQCCMLLCELEVFISVPERTVHFHD